MAGAQAVGAGVPAANDQYALPSGKNGDGWVDGIACVAAILLRQKLHRVMDAFQLTARNLEVARMLGAAAEQDRVDTGR